MQTTDLLSTCFWKQCYLWILTRKFVLYINAYRILFRICDAQENQNRWSWYDSCVCVCVCVCVCLCVCLCVCVCRCLCVCVCVCVCMGVCVCVCVCDLSSVDFDTEGWSVVVTHHRGMLHLLLDDSIVLTCRVG